VPSTRRRKGLLPGKGISGASQSLQGEGQVLRELKNVWGENGRGLLKILNQLLPERRTSKKRRGNGL